MLHFYDKKRAASLLALAAAGGALAALPAAAGGACDLSDGYGETLVSYVDEVDACLSQTDAFASDTEDAVYALTNAAREQAGVAPLQRRDTLDKAARAHALDMAERNYAGHTDLEGRGHTYRMRAIDRQVLASSTGANVVILDADANAEAVYDTIRSDAANRENLTRSGFTDTGLGIARSGDRLYVVQMLATVDGELETPLPLQISDATSFSPRINQEMFRPAGWNLTDASGNRLAGGKMMRMPASSLESTDSGYLDVLVELDTDTYVLRGPIVSPR
ncbi:CAP domain-containing protein [Henriciella aquimarina]|uniref:CAP domain-containing protein n=1 Tax=Henriciella aquimarina TaxID=545261 RepID=UPI001301D320|nr:CAP domain-containing protein [Henriciella aquimarina]